MFNEPQPLMSAGMYHLLMQLRPEIDILETLCDDFSRVENLSIEAFLTSDRDQTRTQDRRLVVVHIHCVTSQGQPWQKHFGPDDSEDPVQAAIRFFRGACILLGVNVRE